MKPTNSPSEITADVVISAPASQQIDLLKALREACDPRGVEARREMRYQSHGGGWRGGFSIGEPTDEELYQKDLREAAQAQEVLVDLSKNPSIDCHLSYYARAVLAVIQQ
jgi:hypothetical protein